MPGLNASPKYRSFIQDRDRALEKLLSNSHARITDYTNAALREIESEAALLCHRHASASFPQTRALVHQFDERISRVFYFLSTLITREINALMRRSYVLSCVGEAEAIARATGEAKYNVHGKDAKQANPERIQYLLNQARYKILKAFEQGIVLEETSTEIMERVKKAFPELKKYLKAPRQLKPLKESAAEDERDPVKDAADGFISEEDWQDVVHDYLTEYVPQYSGRGETVGEFKGDEYDARYGWEIESEANHAFVDQVRTGQNEIANQNGYTDMVWIAILDNKTDDCCEWRNGLTSSEIEASLEDEHADDDCDAIVPPAHFNCRCSQAPYTEDLGEPEKVDFSDFDAWLKDQ
jgi:hypothetical protein